MISTAQRSSSNRGAAPWCARVSSINPFSVVGTADTLTRPGRPQTSLTRASITRPNTTQERGELLELCDAVRANAIDGIGAIDRVWFHPRSTNALRWNDDDPRRSSRTVDAIARLGRSLRPRVYDVRRATTERARAKAWTTTRAWVSSSKSSGSSTGSFRRVGSEIRASFSTFARRAAMDRSTDTVDEEPRGRGR